MCACCCIFSFSFFLIRSECVGLFLFCFVLRAHVVLSCVHCIRYEIPCVFFILSVWNELHCIAQTKIQKKECIYSVCDSCIYAFRLIIRCKVACLYAHGQRATGTLEIFYSPIIKIIACNQVSICCTHNLLFHCVCGHCFRFL